MFFTSLILANKSTPADLDNYFTIKLTIPNGQVCECAGLKRYVSRVPVSSAFMKLNINLFVVSIGFHKKHLLRRELLKSKVRSKNN